MTETKNLLDQFPGGVTGLFCGPPGTGKSELLGSACDLVADPVKEVTLIAPKPNEVNSARYMRHGIAANAKVFRDHKWRPSVGLYEADGFKRMMEYIYSLYDDTQVGVVLFDPLTDAVELASHTILKGEQAQSPKDLRDPLGYYGAMRKMLKELVTGLTGLASPDLPRPKHVFVAVHAQPTKEEDIKGKETTEGRAKGVSFFGEALPMVEGGYRQDIAGEFDIMGFTTVKHETVREGTKLTKQTRYLVQLAPDNERHAKVRLAGKALTEALPNNLEAILKAVLAV